MQQLVGAPPISDDGRWWWDGQSWQSLISPDGMYRWDGLQWVSAAEPSGPGSVAASPGAPDDPWAHTAAPEPAPPPAVAAPAPVQWVGSAAPDGPVLAATPAAGAGLEPPAVAAADAALPPRSSARTPEHPSWLDTAIAVPLQPYAASSAEREAARAAASPARRSGISLLALLTDSRIAFVLIVLVALAAGGIYELINHRDTLFYTPVLTASDAKLAYKAGAVQRYALHQDMHGRLICGCGKPADSFSAVDAVVSETVNGVASDGTATVTLKFETLSGSFDGQPIAFDAAKAKPITLRLSPDGRVVSGGGSGTAGGDALDSVPGGDQYSSIMPAKDVKQGESWGREFDRPNPIGTGNLHYVTSNTFVRNDQLDGNSVAVVRTSYFLPVDMLLDLHQLLALSGADASIYPAGSGITYKGSEKGDVTTYVDTTSHQVALAQDVSDFDFQMSFKGLPNTPQFAGLQGVIHFTGRQNATMRLVAK